MFVVAKNGVTASLHVSPLTAETLIVQSDGLLLDLVFVQAFHRFFIAPEGHLGFVQSLIVHLNLV
jgi:hypothetical protein